MTDRELLEAAAKAAQIEHPGGEHSMYNDGRLWDCKMLRWWNPLTDDGDALRLAVKLNLHKAIALAHRGITDDTDFYAATRRAIVCAAAAIAYP